MNKHYQICCKCIMDTSDPEISFNENGVCNYCLGIEKRLSTEKQQLKSKKILSKLVDDIKAVGKGKQYDCLIGVSGGVDSTYVAYKVKELGLRPLAVHLDNGWNSELAVGNIEKVLKNLDIDLYTYVLDWEEFKDLQLSFIKSGTPDLEIPTDHAIIAILYKMAAKKNIKYIISGGNTSTEGIMPELWSYGHRDWRYINSVHKQFGTKKLISFPKYTILGRFFYNFFKGIKMVRVLDYIDYNKKEAIDFIVSNFGWVNYGGKHYESIYTRFYQGYILPTRFGIDKRRAHLSTMINTGQISREQALEEIKKPTYEQAEKMDEDRIFVVKKFGMNEKEFNEIMSSPIKTYKDYPNYNQASYKRLKKIYFVLRGLI